MGVVDETWSNPALPAVFGAPGSHGKDGRLNGPVDNPLSSCASCHSTAQVVAGVTSGGGNDLEEDFLGVRMVPTGCSGSEDDYWFRNVVGGTPFGMMSETDDCVPATGPAPAGLSSLDYSLQLKDGLISALWYRNPNPCIDSIPPEHLPGAWEENFNELLAGNKNVERRSIQTRAPALEKARQVKLDTKLVERIEKGQRLELQLR